MKITVCNICDERKSELEANDQHFLVDIEGKVFFQIRQSNEDFDFCSACYNKSLHRAQLMTWEQMQEHRKRWNNEQEAADNRRTDLAIALRDAGQVEP